MVKFTVCLLYTVIILSIFLSVLSRYIQKIPSLFWTQELAQCSFVWLCLLASSLAIQRKAQVGINIIYKYLPDKLRKILMQISHLFIIILLIIFVIYGIKESILNLQRRSPMLKISMAPIFLIMPVSSILMMIEEIILLFNKDESTRHYKKV